MCSFNGLRLMNHVPGGETVYCELYIEGKTYYVLNSEIERFRNLPDIDTVRKQAEIIKQLINKGKENEH